MTYFDRTGIRLGNWCQMVFSHHLFHKWTLMTERMTQITATEMNSWGTYPFVKQGLCNINTDRGSGLGMFSALANACNCTPQFQVFSRIVNKCKPLP
jgi:hypothetical protein